MLGEVNLKLHQGVCPYKYQNPSGKVLDVCFPWPASLPFIMTKDPLSGSDLHVLKIFEEKFHFSSYVKEMDPTLLHILSVTTYSFLPLTEILH